VTVALDDAASPAARLLEAEITAHAARWRGARSFWLQPTAAAPILAARRAGARVHVAHRKWPAVQALRRAWPAIGRTTADGEPADGEPAEGEPAEEAVRHGHGALGLPRDGAADVVVLTVPEERVAFHQMLFDALARLAPRGRLLLVGATGTGVKPAVRLLESLIPSTRVIAHAGGHRLVEAMAPPRFDLAPLRALVAPWHDPDAFRTLPVELAGGSVTLHTRPGVFSWDHLDEATALLAGHLEVSPGERVLDLGGGGGALAVAVLQGAPTATVTLVEADSEALRAAERSLAPWPRERWRVLASDVTSAVSGERFDLVVTNPPFHAGKQVALSLPRRFLEEAHAVLRPGGRLLLVANRTLPYEADLARGFGRWLRRHDGPRFKVLEATRR
jgi:16S rRNA (guanine1207-N2)-methyltransferase